MHEVLRPEKRIKETSNAKGVNIAYVRRGNDDIRNALGAYREIGSRTVKMIRGIGAKIAAISDERFDLMLIIMQIRKFYVQKTAFTIMTLVIQ
jgi:hypothetical protein